MDIDGNVWLKITVRDAEELSSEVSLRLTVSYQRAILCGDVVPREYSLFCLQCGVEDR
jgi:hypothetical protein